MITESSKSSAYTSEDYFIVSILQMSAGAKECKYFPRDIV